MSLAFFYLVIGDLIIYHQKAIFNYDAFAGQPINKPSEKTNKDSIYKLKDKSGHDVTVFLTFVSDYADVFETSRAGDFEIIAYPSTIRLNISPPVVDISFRGPPSL